MGLFGSKAKVKPLSKARTLQVGASLELIDVDPGFVEWARATKPAEPKVGHRVTVRVQMLGPDVVVMAGDGSVVGRLKPETSEHYRDEFGWMADRGEYGVAEVTVCQAGNRSGTRLLMNYDQACRDGGII